MDELATNQKTKEDDHMKRKGNKETRIQNSNADIKSDDDDEEEEEYVENWDAVIAISAQCVHLFVQTN